MRTAGEAFLLSPKTPKRSSKKPICRTPFVNKRIASIFAPSTQTCDNGSEPSPFIRKRKRMELDDEVPTMVDTEIGGKKKKMPQVRSLI